MHLTAAGIPIEVHLGPDEWAEAIRREVAAGLTSQPREVSPTWLYDDRGCELFGAITRLPEYYPTRAERAILGERAGEIAAIADAQTLVELGAGTSEKTRLLLDAMSEHGRLERFVLFDVAQTTLRATAEVVGDFRRHLGRIPANGRRPVAFLGGTIGNLRPTERAALLAELAAAMGPGESLLLGPTS